MTPFPEEDDVPHLQALAAEIRTWRRRSGRSQRAIGVNAGISTRSIAYLEAARMKPREATVRRIGRTLGELAGADPGEVEEALIRAVGPALSPPSERQARIEKRRDRKVRQVKKWAAIIREADERESQWHPWLGTPPPDPPAISRRSPTPRGT